MGSHDFRPCPVEPDYEVPVPLSVLKKLFKLPFAHQRSRAKSRGIEFKLTFNQWFNIWFRSGKLLERGARRNQYVMGRHNDVGAYEVGNVSIITQGQNISDAKTWIGRKHTPETKLKVSIARQLRPRKEVINVPRPRYNAQEYPL